MRCAQQAVSEAIEAIQVLQAPHALSFIERLSIELLSAFKRGNKVILAGNGGSLCDAAHFAEELTGFFRSREREALCAIVLNDPGHITCVGNDLGFDHIFSRGVAAHGKPGDLFIALTTSGNSTNLVNALQAARELGLITVAFLGKGGGAMKGEADIELCIDGFPYSDRVQEAHMTAIHIAIELLENSLLKELAGV
jgi:D-sedoheptulose 7-phosphate isomerase